MLLHHRTILLVVNWVDLTLRHVPAMTARAARSMRLVFFCICTSVPSAAKREEHSEFLAQAVGSQVEILARSFTAQVTDPKTLG